MIQQNYFQISIYVYLNFEVFQQNLLFVLYLKIFLNIRDACNYVQAK